MSFRYSSADHARTVRVRTLPSELTASANLATLSPLGASTKMTRSLSRMLMPVNAERGQRVQVCCRMIADEVDGPGADEHEQRDLRDDGGADHDVAPFYLLRDFRGAAKGNSSGSIALL